MATETISIAVDADAARVFSTAPPEVRHKLEVLLDLRLRELTTKEPPPLKQIMDEIGAQAQERGLTPQSLEDLFH